ncbi:hypothetical protein CTI12_AA054790 [Artemisia annua]|uniref:Secreted protein n=1 Tax=Artemisia annua TaxID=35608 RepID=A0A2U1N6C6_ARTAN|nr:hypothetical protein CTI12_AA264320 [Artemisia annua]PWA94925.1 hypothetical protein CTI12_AA054790 [Artemisia annua]
MKLNRIIAIVLVVLFTIALVSSAARTHQTTNQPQTQKQKGDTTFESEKVAHTDSTWGGCYGCWKTHDRRLLL